MLYSLTKEGRETIKKKLQGEEKNSKSFCHICNQVMISKPLTFCDCSTPDHKFTVHWQCYTSIECPKLKKRTPNHRKNNDGSKKSPKFVFLPEILKKYAK